MRHVRSSPPPPPFTRWSSSPLERPESSQVEHGHRFRRSLVFQVEIGYLG